MQLLNADATMFLEKKISKSFYTWKNRAQKLLKIHDVPVRPKIENPYLKLVWRTLCSIYFVV